MRHLLQSNSSVSSPPTFVQNSLPNLSGSQAVLYAIVVTAVILVVLCLTMRALFLRVSGRYPEDPRATLALAEGFSADGIRRAGASTGLNQAIVASFPKYIFDGKSVSTTPGSTPASLSAGADSGPNDSGCIVCLEEYQEGEHLRRLPECGHAFHAECIDAWFGDHSTCPVCRTSLQPKGEELGGAPTSETTLLPSPTPGQLAVRVTAEEAVV